MEMKVGVKGHSEIVVTEDVTAAKVGSGLLPVYGTPSLMALIEGTCFESIGEFLEEGQGTVGTLLNVKHVAATPIGMKVTCESELVEVDRKRLVFDVKAYDEVGLIAEGIHERFIIDNEKFLAKAQAKAAK